MVPDLPAVLLPVVGLWFTLGQDESGRTLPSEQEVVLAREGIRGRRARFVRAMWTAFDTERLILRAEAQAKMQEDAKQRRRGGGRRL